MSSSIASSDRRFDLDWLRIAAFALLILYHVGMFYVPWDWHVKSSHVTSAIEPLMRLSNPWRLALLFVISGMATRFMIAKGAGWPLARTRSARLLLPLAFGMLVIVPPQTWAEVVEKLGFAGSWWEFYGLYLSFHDGWRPGGKLLIVPTWNHLWFVAYLWAYTMLALALVPLLGSVACRRLAALLAHPAALLLLPWLYLAAARILLRPIFGQTHALVDDWYLHVAYGGLFLLGFLAAPDAGIWRAIDRLRWLALGLALGAWAILSFSGLQPGPVAGPALWALQQWTACVALLGLAQRWLNRDGPLRVYLTRAIFPYYIVHQTAIVVAGHTLSGLALPAWLEAGSIIAITIIACVVTFEAVRRVGWLRLFFGLPKHEAHPPNGNDSQAGSLSPNRRASVA